MSSSSVDDDDDEEEDDVDDEEEELAPASRASDMLACFRSKSKRVIIIF